MILIKFDCWLGIFFIFVDQELADWWLVVVHAGESFLHEVRIWLRSFYLVLLCVSNFHSSHFGKVFILNKLIEFIIDLSLDIVFLIPVLAIRGKPLRYAYRLFNLL